MDQGGSRDEQDAVIPLAGRQPQGQRRVGLAGAGQASNILPIDILPKSRSITAFARAMGSVSRSYAGTAFVARRPISLNSTTAR